MVTFMAAHPDGFSTLSDAAEGDRRVQPHRSRPANVDGLHQCYGSVTTTAGSGGGTRIHSLQLRLSPRRIDHGNEQFDAISHLLIDGARRVNAPTLLVRGLGSDVVSQATVDEFNNWFPNAETVDVSGTGHMIAGDDNDAFGCAVSGSRRNLLGRDVGRAPSIGQ